MSKFSLDLFLQACGASGPLHLSVEHAGAAERYVLHQPFALVGGDPRADVRLTGGLVARRHAYLQVLGGRLVCVDLAGFPTSPPETAGHRPEDRRRDRKSVV